MKTKDRYWLTFLALIVSLSPLVAQKPTVEVTFTIQDSTPFYHKYEDNLGEMQPGILDSLIQGLNNNIGFAQFGKASSSDQFNVVLDAKFRGTSTLVQDHYLFFEFIHDNSRVDTGQWLLFKSNQLGENSTAIIEQVSQRWNSYLLGHYKELVDKMFYRLPVALNDPKQYIMDTQLNKWEAILPLTKENLSLDTEWSKFKVTVDLKESNGSTTTNTQEDISYSGDYDQNVTVGNQSLKGCLRLRLQPLPSLTPIKGKVYIIKYVRKVYLKTTDPDDFLNNL